MLSVKLLFPKDVDLDALAAGLSALPPPLAPIRFSEHEMEMPEGNLLSDQRAFDAFKAGQPTQIQLWPEDGPAIEIASELGDLQSIAMELESADSAQVRGICECLSGSRPLFGYACEIEEFQRRNNHDLVIGEAHIDVLVGVDASRYLSGVYWHTLVSDEILERHGVALADLGAEAVSAQAIGDGALHLLKFFDEAGDWRRHAVRLDALCERTDGVFSRALLAAAVEYLHDWEDYMEVRERWR